MCNICEAPKIDVYCHGCGVSLCRKCWRFHDCGVLTDRNGWLVDVGSVVGYPNSDRIYILLETEQTLRNSHVMYGKGGHKGRGEDKRIVYVRLTELKEQPDWLRNK